MKNNKRVLLKLSGETLSGNGKSICSESLQKVVDEIKSVLSKKVELSIVVGAGNIWRGAGKEIDRVSADKMGMLATVMNAIAISEGLKSNGIKLLHLPQAVFQISVKHFLKQKQINI